MILFLTDQEREIQHFPPNWMRENLPGLRRLKRHGLSFESACTAACMCSPSRSSLMTGYFPAQHGVKYTLESNMDASEYPQVNLPTDAAEPRHGDEGGRLQRRLQGQVALLETGGRRSGALGPRKVRLQPLGSAGRGRQPERPRGGRRRHQQRRPDHGIGGQRAAGHRRRAAVPRPVAGKQEPFFLVISLVNPHDVLFYPSRTFEESGYDDSWLGGDIELPQTNEEDLSTKPSVQEDFLKIFNLTGKPESDAEKRAYLNFYGNLMRSSDNYVVEVLDKLEKQDLIDDTLIIRTSDHGEMGLAHGGLRQKNFNFYEETLKVPLVYSNPKMYPQPITSEALVSHVDLLPTLASLAGAPASARSNWQGVDYSDIVLNPRRGGSAQDYVAFTYDDFQSGQANGPYPKEPNHVTSIREKRWKLAKYSDIKTSVSKETGAISEKPGPKPPQWEMYDLKTDPYEEVNLAFDDYERTAVQEREFLRLKKKLAKVEKTRLRPLAKSA